jgi:uncharacterized protein DUF4339
LPPSSATRWFYVDNGRRHGPVEFDELIERLLHGSLSPEAAVWHAGLSEWVKATMVPEIVSQLPPPLPPAELPAPDPDHPPRLQSVQGDDIDDDEDDGPPEGVSFEPPEGMPALEAQSRRRRRHRHRVRGSEPRWDLLAILAVALIVLVMVLWRMFTQGDTIPSGIVGAAVRLDVTSWHST